MVGRKRGSSNTAEPATEDEPQCLADLQLGKVVDQEAVRAVLAELPQKNPNQKQQLVNVYEEQFPSWSFRLRQGFSLLFYGFGSKRSLLEKFALESMADEGILSINGLFPSVTAEQILLKVACMLAHAPPSQFRGVSAQSLLQPVRASPRDLHVCVLLHNIDGPGLRSANSQSLLSKLAACPNVYLAASMDHIHTPLLWDKQRMANFNWLWHDVTTYQRYSTETVGVPSLLMGCREQTAKAGAAVVLKTLVPNARAVFNLIAYQQLDDETESGIPFHVLYRRCRERFLVTNEQTLKAHLTEFKDHSLIHTRREEGVEVLTIPMDVSSLQQLLKDLEAAE